MPAIKVLFREEGQAISLVKAIGLVRMVLPEGGDSLRTITRPQEGIGTGRGIVSSLVSIDHRTGVISVL